MRKSKKAIRKWMSFMDVPNVGNSIPYDYQNIPGKGSLKKKHHQVPSTE